MSEESSTPIPSHISPAEALQQASSPRRRFGDVERLEEATSTNKLLVERARAGARDGSVLVADRQSEGRGRRSRTWVSAPEGALLCSVLFRPPLPLDELHCLSSIVALATINAARELSGARLLLKWPNDLIANDKKVAGTLAEMVSSAPPVVVVGIGCNLYWPTGWPAVELAPALVPLLKDATTLEGASGVRISRDAFLEAFLDELDVLYGVLLGTDGPAVVAAAQLAACATVGQLVRVETPTGALTGTAVGIRSDGALEVEVDGVVRALNVAEVVHLRAGS